MKKGLTAEKVPLPVAAGLCDCCSVKLTVTLGPAEDDGVQLLAGGAEGVAGPLRSSS